MSDQKRNVIEIWEPTYRLKPKDSERFVPIDVRNVIQEVVERKLKKQKYEDEKCKALTMEVCAEIKEEVKKLSIPRYKIVVQGTIGESKGQGAFVASRCLWDHETDNCATFNFQNQYIFCVVMVFGLYLE